jgi:hypothetical protein
MTRIAITLLAAAVLFAGGADAATVVISNLDGAGEGFNDPTPVTPVGGNPGTTLGQQRLNAFTYAANKVAVYLNSPVTIVVEAKMDALTCTSTGAVLGSAGTTTVHRNFSGAPQSNTWYPAALANALAGTDLAGGSADIAATFNSSLNGDAGCLGGKGWYYGYDENPGGDIDFITVVMHEICHGLGFQTFVSQTGGRFLDANDTYMLNLQRVGATPSSYAAMSDVQREAANISDPNLVWTGSEVGAMPAPSAGTTAGMVRVHAPNPYQPGSSVSHWSTAVSPNEIMEPSYTGADHYPGLALQLFKDIGWPMNDAVVSVAITSFDARAIGDGVEIEATFSSDFEAVDVRVYRADGAGDDFALIDDVPAAGTGTFRYRDGNVAPGREYTYRIGVIDGDGEFMSPSSTVNTPAVAAALDQNVPNPFNPSTAIRFSLSNPVPVRLYVFDAGGRLVQTLVDTRLGAGSHTVVWDGRDRTGNRVGSGIYFYRLEAGSFVESRKMVLVK